MCVHVFVILFLASCSRAFFIENSDYELQQVVILTRHNVRTPLSKQLSDFSPYVWPKWNEKSGFLTKHGALLEGYMGHYFVEALRKFEVLPKGCPDSNTLFVYSNVKERTLATASAFVKKGLPNCNITIFHKNSTSDPIFNPFIHNSSQEFKKEAMDEMQTKLDSINVTDAFNYLQNLVNYTQSEDCIKNKHCNLSSDKHEIYFQVGDKPKVIGPLKTSNSIVDAFLMEYYDGKPMKDVAWGKIRKSEQWDQLIMLKKAYHHITLNSTLIARDIAKPLITAIQTMFKSKQTPKVTLLVGHDSNIQTVVKSLEFNMLPVNSLDIFGVGDKVVFQKWFDKSKKVDLLRVNYVYASWDQLRHARKLTWNHPPQSALLVSDNCAVDDMGFCSWSEFMALLENAVA